MRWCSTTTPSGATLSSAAWNRARACRSTVRPTRWRSRPTGIGLVARNARAHDAAPKRRGRRAMASLHCPTSCALRRKIRCAPSSTGGTSRSGCVTSAGAESVRSVAEAVR
jgi:hypothetical protein